jgi:hypothetical protein
MERSPQTANAFVSVAVEPPALAIDDVERAVLLGDFVELCV